MVIAPGLLAFLGLTGLVAAERLVELALSRRNAARAIQAGGREHGQGHFPWMVALHTSLLAAGPAEVLLLDRPFLPWLAALSLSAVAATMGLRYWAISALGDRWNTRVIVVPGRLPITGGPYRWVRHPNYLAVIAEIVALPLFHTAWLTALTYTLLNAWMLSVRIRVEERALAEGGGYQEALGDRPRFVPEGR